MDDIATALTASLAKDGQTTPTANLPMGGYRHSGVANGSARNDYAALGQVQDGTPNWVDAGGTADAITATYSPALTALVDGQTCHVRAGAANATTTPTFAPNGITARTIVKEGGQALAPGDIRGDGHELIFRYDLTNTRWEFLNPALAAGSITTAKLADNAVTGAKIAMGSDAQGDILYYNGTDYARLGAGTGGQFLKTQGTSANPQWAAPPAVVADSRGLVCQYASAATADIDADEVVLKDGSGNVHLASAVNLTVSLASSGANGLDTGSEGTSTWYYLWVIYNATTTTVAGLISASASAPTMPSGYTFKALVGAAYNDSGSDLRRFWQHGRRCLIAREVIFTGQAGSTSYTSQSISAAVPPIAKSAIGLVGISSSGAAHGILVAGDANGVGEVGNHGNSSTAAVDSWYQAGSFEVPLITAQTIYWIASNSGSFFRLSISGWSF